METLPLTEFVPRESTSIDPVSVLPSAGPDGGLAKAAVIVCSDRASSGVYEDRSGPVAVDWLRSRGYGVSQAPQLISDEALDLIDALEAALAVQTRLIVISGGTGLGPRDITPQTLDKSCDYQILGFGELLRRESLKYSHNAYLSRCGAWVKHRSLVLALPGSPKAVAEQLEILADLLPRALAALSGTCHHHPASRTPRSDNAL